MIRKAFGDKYKQNIPIKKWANNGNRQFTKVPQIKVKQEKKNQLPLKSNHCKLKNDTLIKLDFKMNIEQILVIVLHLYSQYCKLVHTIGKQFGKNVSTLQLVFLLILNCWEITVVDVCTFEIT